MRNPLRNIGLILIIAGAAMFFYSDFNWLHWRPVVSLSVLLAGLALVIISRGRKNENQT